MIHQMGTSTIGIRANIAAYEHGEPWLDDLLVYLRANRDHLARELSQSVPGLTVNNPEGTYFSWLDLRGLDLPAEPTDYLFAKAKVGLSPGFAFGAETGTGFVRLNFATSREILDRAIEAMVRALRNPA